jgi:hypothetical protein
MPLSRICTLIVALIPAAMAGCAADSALLESLLFAPGYFDNFDCPEIVAQFHSASERVAKLTTMMEKAANDPTGPLVNAIAYNTDYAKARTAQKYAEQTAQRKGCDLAKKPESATRDSNVAGAGSPGRNENFGVPNWRR